MTNEEIIQRGQLINDETEPAQNTSERVGGVIKGIGQNLADKDTAIAAEAARNGYYQCTVSGTELAVTAPGFTLPAHGGNIRIKMSAPASGACTLNINGTGAKALLYNGAALSSANTWEKDEIISVFYDPSGSGQYLASNSQGGGGKAEKIKYDNSQSGLSADDVQDAIDEVADNMTDKLLIGTLSYGSSYSNTEFHLKAGHTYHFDVTLASGTTSTAVSIRASDSTITIAAFNTANFGTSFSWKCTQDSAYLRSSNCSITIYEVVNKAESQFVKVAELGDFITGTYLINTTYKRWESQNSTHKYIQVKDGWKTIDVTANANVRTSLVFTMNHSPSNNASVGVCNGGIYSIPAGTSLNSIAIPSDCAFICVMAWNANANLDMTPSSLIVNGDIDTRFNETAEDINSNTGKIEGISNSLMAEIGKVVCSVAGYENLSFPLNQGNLYRITFTPAVTGSLRIINTDSTYTEIWPSTMDEAIFLYQAEVDSVGFRVGGAGTTVKVESMVNVGNIVDDAPTVKYIKSDGSGDYTSIQQAINDITDASPTKKYELRVCDDESYTSATQLWLVSSPSSHADSASSPAACASIITKDYINIVGWNRRRKVSVRLADIGTAYVQNVVAMHLQGNVVVENMDFEVENCRYAIHQESGGNAASLDYHATTEMKNCDVTHLGGVKCTTWTSTYAQANGACHGLHCIYKNVKWYPGYYMHSNLNFDAPVKAEYYNCSIAQKGTGDILNPTLGLPYVGNNGQGHRARIHVEGCSMLAMYGKTGMMDNNTIENSAHDYRTQLPIITGHGNVPMVLMPLKPDVLAVKSVNSNVNITSIGGSAAADIFGNVWKSYAGTADKYGVMLGSEAIQQRGTTYNYTLAYRLGNCASSPKTLTITVGSTTESATLDKDFKTNRTTYTDAAIVNYINSQLTNCQVVLAASNADFIEAEPWDDCKEMVVNADTRTMMYGMAVRRRAGNQWVICDSGNVPQGVVCERINPNGYGKVAILDKSIFTDLYGVNATAGQRIIPADGGAWTVNSNGLLKAVSNNAYQFG